MEAHKDYALKRLIEGASANQISKEIPVHRSTITRWLKNDPEFQEALGGTVLDAGRRLDQLVPEAITVLELGLKGKKTVSQARVALDIIKAAAQVGKLGDGDTTAFQKRLAELDARNNRPDNGDALAIPD